MTSGEHELLERPLPQDRPVAVVDDSVRVHDVAKRPVRELEDDAVPWLQAVDVAERLQVGRPVAGDGDDAAETRASR